MVSKDGSFRVYLLAVCFVSVVCVAITSGLGLYSLLKLAAPELTLDTHSHNAHQSLENFKKSHYYAGHFNSQAFFVPGPMGVAGAMPMRQAELLRNGETRADKPQLPDDEIELLRQKSYETLIGNHQRNALQELFRKGIVLLVAGILLLVHWRPFQNYDNHTA
ncbi:MAG: zinc transporter ZupT [Halieaceae bacterium]